MADVFVTAVFVALLSANAAPATMQGQVEPGLMDKAHRTQFGLSLPFRLLTHRISV